jgi:hypothetical protein
MESKESQTQQKTAEEQEAWIVEGAPEEEQPEPKTVKEAKTGSKEKEKQKLRSSMLYFGPSTGVNRKVFINGLSVGLGIGCITTFVVMWLAVFFTPQMPAGATYQDLLSIFIFPMIYLLAIGLITLTLGIVREFYAVILKP